jgi:hypothetical protein
MAAIERRNIEGVLHDRDNRAMGGVKSKIRIGGNMHTRRIQLD